MTTLPSARRIGSLFGAAEEGDRAQRSLLARALADDREALHALYARFAPAIRRFLHGLTGDITAADDGTQETFVRAFQRLETLRVGDRIAPWLFGIARNVSFEQRRGQRRDGRGGRARDLARPEPAAEAPSPEALLLGREAAERMRDALAGLSEDRRAVLLLRVDHELSYEELSAVMGWTLAKVKVEVHRARVALRAHMSELEEDRREGV